MSQTILTLDNMFLIKTLTYQTLQPQSVSSYALFIVWIDLIKPSTTSCEEYTTAFFVKLLLFCTNC